MPDSTKLNFNKELNKTTPVGSYEAGKSDYGVYDLSGNVAEWTYDWHFAEFYIFSPKITPIRYGEHQLQILTQFEADRIHGDVVKAWVLVLL